MVPDDINPMPIFRKLIKRIEEEKKDNGKKQPKKQAKGKKR
jgi:hypothetical protein